MIQQGDFNANPRYERVYEKNKNKKIMEFHPLGVGLSEITSSPIVESGCGRKAGVVCLRAF